jgi:transposase
MSKKEAKPQGWKEARRKRGWELHESGWKQKAIAEALGVAESTVSEWVQKGNAGGIEALRNQPGRGRRPKLSDEQRKKLPELLQRGAESYGFRGDIWTNPRVAQVIRREFGISYHPAHVSRILEELGWTPQKPIRRAKQRKEEEVQKWWKERLPELEKKPVSKGEPSSL